jgi:hypothetical protein
MNSARPELRLRLNRMLNMGILAPKHARPKPSTPDGNTAAARRMVAGVAVIELLRPPGVKSDIGEISNCLRDPPCSIDQAHRAGLFSPNTPCPGYSVSYRTPSAGNRAPPQMTPSLIPSTILRPGEHSRKGAKRRWPTPGSCPSPKLGSSVFSTTSPIILSINVSRSKFDLRIERALITTS